MAGTRSLGSLTLDLIAKIGGFTGPLSAAERELDARAKRMNKIAANFGKNVGIAISAGATAAATALVALTKQAIDNADAIRDLSIRVGTSTETLSAYAYAAKQTGTDIETLGKGMKILAKNATDALNPTSAQAKVFDALGIKVTDAEGKLKDLSVLVPEIADRFKALEDGTTKAALAQALFGKSGLELTEFLNQGAEGLKSFTDRARELGVVIDQDTADKADKFNDTLGDLKAVASGLGLQIAKELLPQLNELLDSLVKLTNEGGLAKKAAQDIGDGLGFLGTKLAEANDVGQSFRGTIDFLEKAVDSLKGSISSLISLDIGGFFGKLKDANFSAASALMAALGVGTSAGGPFGLFQKANFSNVKSGSGDFGSVTAGSSTADPGLEARLGRALSGQGGSKGSRKAQLSDEDKAAKDLIKTYDQLITSYDQQIALFGKEGEAAKVRYDIEHGELTKLTDAQKENLLVKAQEIDQLKVSDDLRKAADDSLNKETEAYQDHQKAVQGQIEDLKFELSLLSMSNVERQKAIELRYANVDAMSAEGQEISKTIEQIDKASRANQLWDEVQSDLSDTLLDVISGTKSLKDGFMDLVDSIERAILKSITDNWSEIIASWFKSGTGGSGASASGGASSGIDWAGIIGSFFSGGKAGGGPVSAGRMYEVGEGDRPEMLMMRGRQYMIPGNNGNVIPMNRMGGNITVNQTLVSTAPYTKRSAIQTQQEASLQLRQATARR